MNPQDLGRKWLPPSADALLDAYRGGLLEESHWCDLKREIGSNNKETARDLASFSADGGTIVVGIDEKEPDGESRHPVALKGLPERIEQIAQAVVHPPLQVSCYTVGSGDEDGRGYVLVHIPASPLAPHQVDGTYYGRGDKTKIKMAEPQVEQLYQQRAWWNRDAGDMLARHVDEFPPRIGLGHPPYLYAVARPVGGWPDMCKDLVGGASWRDNVSRLNRTIVRDSRVHELRGQVKSPPEILFFRALPHIQKSGRGALISNRPLPHVADAKRDLRLEIAEDGELRLFHNAVSAVRAMNDIHVRLHQIALVVRELLVVAQYISDQCGHSSMWDLGVALDCMNGTHPVTEGTNPVSDEDEPGFPAADYRRTTRVSVLELGKAPGAVTERLLGHLYRTFEITDDWASAAVFFTD